MANSQKTSPQKLKPFCQALVFASALVLQACKLGQARKVEDIPQASKTCSKSKAERNAADAANTPVSYAEIEPIIKQQCATRGCHAQGTGLVPLTTPTEIRTQGLAILRTAVELGTMPLTTKLDNYEKQKLIQWRAQGFPGPVVAAPSPSPSAPKGPGWAEVAPLIQSCLPGCHGQGSKQGDFSTYLGTKTYIKSINQRINRDPKEPGVMPPPSRSGGQKLPSTILQTLSDWEKAGAPELGITAGSTPDNKVPPLPKAPEPIQKKSESPIPKAKSEDC